MRLPLLLTLIGVGSAISCSRGVTPDSAEVPAGEAHSSALAAGQCEEVEREGGPCTLWGPSMIALIAHPELYDGKRVRLIGFVNFEFEGNGLYVSREDWRQSIHRNGIWIEAPKGFESDSAPAVRQPNQRYVLVEGTFSAGDHGHLGMWSGALKAVTRLQAWGRDSTETGR